MAHAAKEPNLSFSLMLIHLDFFSFLRWSLTSLPRLEQSCVILAHYNLCTPGSSSAPALASQVDRVTGAHHHIWLLFVFLVEMGFHHVGQAGLKLLTSGEPPDSASQNDGIIGMSHYIWPHLDFNKHMSLAAVWETQFYALS